MRLRLIHRFFLAFAALSVAALLAFALLQQDGFRRGFLDYLDNLSAELISEGSARLADRYVQEGSWEFLRERPHVLMEALGIADDARSRAGLSAPVSVDWPPPNAMEEDRRPWPRDPMRDDRRPPPLREGQQRPRARFLPGDRPRPPPRAADPMDIGGRLTLLDAEGRIVVHGPNRSENARSFDVLVDGTVVGRLLLSPLPHWSGRLDEAFARSQWQRALTGGVAILILALGLAWLLARWLRQPIRALAQGAQALAAGDYAMRVSAGSGDELAELAADFNRLAEALERNRTARRQWGVDIAHELRTPLAILHGEIQALQDGVRAVGPDTLTSLQAETTRLTRLVEDLYQLALSDAGALEYQQAELDLGELLIDVVRTHQPMLRDAGIELTLLDLPARHLPIRGDARRLHQLFANLIGNSLRYTDRPGKVRLSVSQGRGHWSIHLDDTPPGVPAASLPHLFERLYRVESSRNRASGGAGLGLAIAHNIVAAHAGRIAAHASPLGGLRITIELPSMAEQRI
jgi:two-component system, OmpR family, sensor histidine kinase BaeS